MSGADPALDDDPDHHALLDQLEDAEVQAIGAPAVNQAVKAITIARTYLEHEWAGPRSEVSLLEYDKALNFAGHDRVFPQGYSQLTDKLASDSRILLGHEVKQIDYSGTLVDVLTNHGSYHAHHVLVTVPLGVLQAGRIAFNPSLPASKREAIREGTRLRFRPVMMTATVAALGLVPFLFARGPGSGGMHHGAPFGHMMDRMWSPPTHSALQILNERFARGEIQKDEYEDKKAAILSGINVKRMTVINFALIGFLAALAGIPTLLVANKLDEIKRRTDLLPWLQQMQDRKSVV